MAILILTPPVTFAIYLLISIGVSAMSKRLAARGTDSAGKEQAYACGEDMPENQGQPDYREFFMFAFFFTIIHVIALVVATSPHGMTVPMAVYLGVTVLALSMLLRK